MSLVREETSNCARDSRFEVLFHVIVKGRTYSWPSRGSGDIVLYFVMVFFKDVDVTVIRFASLVEIACPSISTYQQGSISKSACKNTCISCFDQQKCLSFSCQANDLKKRFMTLTKACMNTCSYASSHVLHLTDS